MQTIREEIQGMGQIREFAVARELQIGKLSKIVEM
jgi:hypothetical protein